MAGLRHSILNVAAGAGQMVFHADCAAITKGVIAVSMHPFSRKLVSSYRQVRELEHKVTK